MLLKVQTIAFYFTWSFSVFILKSDFIADFFSLTLPADNFHFIYTAIECVPIEVEEQQKTYHRKEI